MERKFRLEVVLDLRRRKEEQIQIAFAELERALVEQQAMLDRLRAERARRVEQLAAWARAAAVDVEDLVRGYIHLDWLDARIADQVIAVERAAAAAAAKRQELIAAVKDRKVLDKLKEKHKIAYDGWVEKVEAGALDDLAVTRFARQGKESR